MAEKTVPLTARVPEEEREAVEELADEQAKSKSAMTRELVQRGLEAVEDDGNAQPDATRSVSPVTVLGVVAIAVAPTLLATGYTGLGSVFAAVGGMYALLWVTAYDVALEEALATARDKLREVGVGGFFLHLFDPLVKLMLEDRLVEDPDTIVERATRADIVGLGLFVVVGVVAVPIFVLAQIGLLEPFLMSIGTAGVKAIVLSVTLILGGAVFMFGLWALSMLAIASSRMSDGEKAGASSEVDR